MYKELIEKKTSFIKNIQIPDTYVPSPDQSDYSRGYIERYFIQKTNDKKDFVFEVDSNNYDYLSTNPYWKRIKIKWRISGSINMIKNDKTNMIIDNGVYNDNINVIGKAKKDIPNIDSYLINPIQFYKGRIS